MRSVSRSPRRTARWSWIVWLGLALCGLGVLEATESAAAVAQAVVVAVGTAPASGGPTFAEVFGDSVFGLDLQTVGAALCSVGALAVGLGAVRRTRG